MKLSVCYDIFLNLTIFDVCCPIKVIRFFTRFFAVRFLTLFEMAVCYNDFEIWGLIVDLNVVRSIINYNFIIQ